MSNLSSSSASGKNVNFQGCSHSNDGSVSTWDADCSDIKSEETVKSSFKILLRSSLFTVLLLAVHWSNSNGPYSQWKGEATNEVKVQRNRRMLYNNTGRYVSSDYNASMENLAGSRENNEQSRSGSRGGPSQYNSPPPQEQSSSFFTSPFTTPFTSPFTAPFGSDSTPPSPSPSSSGFSSSPGLSSSFASLFSSTLSPSPSYPMSPPFNSFTAMDNSPPRNNDVWSIYEDGLRYLNNRAFRNMENDFRYPNFMYNSLNQQNNVSNSLYSNLNNNALFYIFSFIAGLFLISQVGAERLFFLASAMGIAYHIRKSVRSS